MSKNLKVNDIPKYTLSAGIKKGELLRLMKVLDPECDSPEVIKNSGKIPSTGSENVDKIIRQNRITRDLLRRYFVLQVAQITGDAG